MEHLSPSKSTTTNAEFTSSSSQLSLSTLSVSIELASDVSTYKQYHNNSRGTNAEPHMMQQQQHHHQQYHQQPKSYDLTLFGGQFLVSDTLYFEVPQSISDNDIVTLLTSCQPILIQRNRYQDDLSTGWIQFANRELADRAYTLFDGIVFKNNCRLQVYMTPDGTKDQIPNAPIFQVNHLPLSMTNNGLYNLFRPFGPIRLCKIIVEKDSTFNGTALLQYFNQKDAENSRMTMNNKYLDGKSISIFSLVSNKPDLSSPANKNQKIGKSDSNSIVDYTNLYIKNLDLATKSADLYSVFRAFGHIISARVMKKPNTKQSRGYGFVSFTRPEDAKAALTQFNGKYILSKPVIIAYHEPKRLAANSPAPSDTVTTPPPTYHHQQKTSPLPMRTSFTKTNKTHQTPQQPQPQPHHHQQPNQPYLQQRSHQNYHQNQPHRVKIASAAVRPILPASSIRPSSPFNSSNISHSLGRNDSSQSQRNCVEAAILQVIGKDKGVDNNLSEWVDYIMSLRSASRALCLFNSSYLLSKLEEAPVTGTYRHQNHYQRQVSANITSSYCCQPQQQHQQHHHYTCTSNTPKTPNLVLPDECNSHTSSSGTSAAVTSTTSTTDIANMNDIGKQEQYQSMARFVESMKGLSLLQQKQRLGDILFPHVKATGTKQASNVTILLLDTQPLDQLAYSMHSLNLLKPLVDQAFLTLTRQKHFIKAVMQK
ncbi:unnamed protein product [Absidia cylindrospora]